MPGKRLTYDELTGATTRVLTKGKGPPLLLLHGHPDDVSAGAFACSQPVGVALLKHHAGVIPRTSRSHGYGHLLANLHLRPRFNAPLRLPGLVQIQLMPSMS